MRKYALLFALLFLVNIPSFTKAADSSPLIPDLQQKLNSPVVTLTAIMYLKPDGLAKAKAEGLAYATKCRQEPGCIQYQVQEDVVDPEIHFLNKIEHLKN
jgi:hypothetical protein